jgi:uncharacterized hydantoinase/oxoprolinase family protein
LGGYYDLSNVWTANADTGSTDYMSVKPNTAYIHSEVLGRFVNYYDANKNFISSFTSETNGQFTTVAGAAYVRIIFQALDIDTIQIELGSTRTAYEPYTSTEVYYPGTLRSLPNGVKDEVNVNTGVKTQRVSDEYALVEGDITVLYTELTNNDLVRVSRSELGMIAETSSGLARVANMTELSIIADWDTVGARGTYTTEGYVDYIDFIVAKGTYANLAAAKAALAGTSLIYQLAVEIPSEIDGLGELIAEPSGSIIIEPAVRFYAKPANGVLTIPAGREDISSIESVKKIDGTTKTSVTPSASDTTTITVAADTSLDTFMFEVVYLYASSETTLPSLTYSYPINRAAQADSTAEMAAQTAKELADFIAYQNAQNIIFDARLTAHSI